MIGVLCYMTHKRIVTYPVPAHIITYFPIKCENLVKI